MAYGILKVDNITFDNGGSDQNVTVSGLYRATTSGVTVSGTIAATTVSGVTIIGSTTVSGATVTGTTANFTSGNFSNIISSAATMSGALIMANQQQVRFREAVGNGVNHIALQAPAIVSADQTITVPDQTGTLITTGDNGSVSSTMLATNLTISTAAGSATAPSIAFTGDTNTGIYSPGADQLAVATNGVQSLLVDGSGNVSVVRGILTLNATGGEGGQLSLSNPTNTANVYSFDALSATEARLFTTANNTDLLIGQVVGTGGTVRFSTSSSERARIDSSGRLGIGTSAPVNALDVNGGIGVTYGDGLRIFRNQQTVNNILLAHTFTGGNDQLNIAPGGNSTTSAIAFQTATGSTLGTRMFIGPTGSVGIGTTSATQLLDLAESGANNVAARVRNANGICDLYTLANGDVFLTAQSAGKSLLLGTVGSERARIDSSGRLLVGTSSARNYNNALNTPHLQLEGLDVSQASFGLARNSANSGGPNIQFGKSRGTVAGSMTAVNAQDDLGRIQFQGADGTQLKQAAEISAHVDGTPGTNDMPGRLVFSTTADGAASPTERMRIDSAGTTTLTSASATAPFIAKISSSEAARIDSSGRLLVGTSSSVDDTFGASSIQVSTTGSNAASFGQYSADSFTPIAYFRKSRGALNTQGLVSSGDNIGALIFTGSDGTGFIQGATIIAAVDGTPGTNDMPGRLVFSTTADGAASPAERLRITSAGVLQVADAGNIAVGTTTGTKIGTGTTQKIGFYNATPVVQPTAVADATDAATVITQLNALLTRMRNLGLIAT